MKPAGKRRDFLFYATAATAGVAAGGALVGLGRSMGSSADNVFGYRTKVDLELVKEGQQITLMSHGLPIFLRHRTQPEIDFARSTPLSMLRDQTNAFGGSDQYRLVDPARDENRSIDPEGRYVIFVGLCTHLGCVPLGDRAGNFDGWFCPCHGSHFDPAGRVRNGPAPRNLVIPDYEWDGGTIISLLEPGELRPLSDEQLDTILYGKKPQL